jgi:hypothetical protein
MDAPAPYHENVPALFLKENLDSAAIIGFSSFNLMTFVGSAAVMGSGNCAAEPKFRNQTLHQLPAVPP